ncbi:MAG: DUF72 domain-containing protein [Thermoprotei archaeon]|nr:MAG: DUF72 domain-containing protein [Thermoprotei archaeon]RLF25504.1 MAG: DUF72 domain-containing protein [Thermoprotei archaeon]
MIYVGTSGWSYDWNPDGFEWYVKNSGLNTVELNASFYRFPFPSMVKSWARRTPEGFIWSIKVNRLITHRYRFSIKALDVWRRFYTLFKPLESKIRFWLFQLPPSYRPRGKMLDNLEKFIEEVNLGEKFVLEWRNKEWFRDEWIRWAEKLKITLCSVDAPDLPHTILKSSRMVYLRMHGRTVWYAYRYNEKELEEVAKRLMKADAAVYAVYFNNNHDMLDNARLMLAILRAMRLYQNK